MSLLDKIDILITPNAYKKGKLFAALPSPTFGGELAVDGDFADGSTAWTLNPGWSIGGNSARYDGNALGTSISQNISGVTGGNRYTVTFEVTQNTGDQNNTVSLGSTTLTNSTHLPLGCNTFTGVAGFGTALNIYGNSGELLIIRNLTVKQELTGIADLDFTRASAATRVDPLGFINYAGVLPGVEQVTNGNFQQIGPEEVSNGDFNQTGPEEVSNGDFSQIGPELVVNGDFATSDLSSFTTIYATQAIVSEELKVTLNTANGYGISNVYFSAVIGKSYRIQADVQQGTANNTIIKHQSGITLTSSGNQTGSWSFDGVGVATATSCAVRLQAYGDNGDYAIFDNVSVKEVGQDWTVTGSDSTHYVEFLSTGARFVSDTTSPVLELKQNAITSGKQYKLTCNIAYTGVGQLRVNVGTNLTPFTEGANTKYFTATSSTMSFLRENANVDCLISNVSVKEVGQDWSYNGATIGDDKANIIGDGSAFTNISQSGVFTSGKQYKVTVDVTINSGLGLKFQDGANNENIGFATTSGSYTFYFSSTSNTTLVIGRRTGGTAFNSSVDNVSVKEVFQGWTIGTSPELSLGSVTFTSNGQNLFQPWTEETGTTYYIQLEGTGSVRLRTGFTGIPAQIIDVTLPDIITVNTDADTNRIQIYGPNTGTAVLTNVSVVEGGEIDIPRIDYTGGGCPHILVEPERTNLITYSEDFSQSYWTKARTTVEPGFISPDGTENAYKLIENTAENVHAFYNSTFGVNNGDTYTISLFIKYNGRQWFRLWGQFGSSNKEAYFDIENGLLGQKDSGLTSKIEDYGNDWYRISASATSDGTNGRFRGYLAEADGDSFYQGDGTSGAFIWGAQYEEGSYETSYIPTEGTTATRAIEKYESAEDISGLIGQTEGTFFIELSKPVLEPDDFYLISLNNAADNSDNNSVAIGFESGSDDFYLRLKAGGSIIYVDNNTASLADTFYKIAIAYKSGQSLIYIDGSPITPNSGSLSTDFSFSKTLDNLSFDYNGNGTLPFYGKVKQLQVYGTALTDEELTLLTIPPNSTYSTYAEMANALNYTLQ